MEEKLGGDQPPQWKWRRKSARAYPLTLPKPTPSLKVEEKSAENPWSEFLDWIAYYIICFNVPVLHEVHSQNTPKCVAFETGAIPELALNRPYYILVWILLGNIPPYICPPQPTPQGKGTYTSTAGYVHVWIFWNSGIAEFWNYEFLNSRIPEFRNLGIPEFQNSRILEL